MGELINGRTPEEIKSALGCFIPCSECPYRDCMPTDEGCAPHVAIDALDLIERLEAKQPKWISVWERSEPPQDGEYWCFGYWIGSGRKQAGTAEYFGEWKISNNFVLTHWMPLPQPPEEGE